MVTIISDAGLGKSRLLDEFRATLTGSRHTWAEWSCAQLLQHTPFHPIVEWARQRFGGPDVPVATRFAELEATLLALGLVLDEAVPALAPLFELPLPDRYPPSKLGPEEARRQQLRMMAAWVIAGAATQPLVLTLEDLQRADPSTLELIGNLIERDLRVPLLVVITTRSEFQAPWPNRAHHEQFALSPLNEADAIKIVQAMVAARGMGGETVDSVVERSGAVLGREFAGSLVEAVAGTDHETLNLALERLGEADMIHAQGRPLDATYRFNHALFQDAAYDSLLKSRRRELHLTVAQALTNRFPGIANSRPELLAHHLTEVAEFESAREDRASVKLQSLIATVCA